MFDAFWTLRIYLHENSKRNVIDFIYSVVIGRIEFRKIENTWPMWVLYMCDRKLIQKVISSMTSSSSSRVVFSISWISAKKFLWFIVSSSNSALISWISCSLFCCCFSSNVFMLTLNLRIFLSSSSRHECWEKQHRIFENFRRSKRSDFFTGLELDEKTSSQ